MTVYTTFFTPNSRITIGSLRKFWALIIFFTCLAFIFKADTIFRSITAIIISTSTCSTRAIWPEDWKNIKTFSVQATSQTIWRGTAHISISMALRVIVTSNTSSIITPYCIGASTIWVINTLNTPLITTSAQRFPGNMRAIIIWETSHTALIRVTLCFFVIEIANGVVCTR